MRIAACLLLLLPWMCPGQSFRERFDRQTAEATRLHGQKQHAKAAAILEELRKDPEFARLGEDAAEALYNLACEYSLVGDAGKALAILGEANAAGGLTFASLQRDSDFDNIRGTTGFLQLLNELDFKETPARVLWNSAALRTPYREDLPEDEKVAGLSRLWSEAKYNFVYFDRLGGLDWDALYLAYLPKVRQTKNTMEYYQKLAEFYARLRDGHTGVSYPRQSAERLGGPMISTRLVEGRVFVDAVRDPALAQEGVTRGLEIVAVDGKPVKQYGEEQVAPTRSASTAQDLASRTFEAALLGGPVDTPVQLTLRDAGGKEFSKTLPRKNAAEASKYPREPWSRFELRMLPGNVAYVALRTFGIDAIVKDFEQAYPEILKSDGLILDVRENGGGSSGTGWAILGFLTDKPFLGTQWRTRDYRPAFRAWGNAEKWYGQPAREIFPRGTDPYRKPVVVLTGVHTFSAAEDFAVVFDVMKRGTIIGEPTGGSTGQPLMFDLPGGGSARVCTKHDRYPDGKEFVGKGIQPQVVVRPTVEDFRAGRDTVLEAALRHLRNAR